MELRHFTYFVTLADHLHFGRAAKVLEIAQPVLSRHIMQMESEIGVQLFERTRRSVQLTHAGSVFLASARQLLVQTDCALQATRHAAEGSLGSLRISCGPITTYGVLPIVLRLLKERRPKIDLHLTHASTAEQVKGLLSHETDVAFLIPPMDHSTLRMFPLLEEHLLVALPRGHELSNRKSVRLSELKEETFVFPPRTPLRTGLYGALMHSCDRAGFVPQVSHEAYPIQTMLALVSAGFGVSLVPESVEKFMRSEVVFLPVVDKIAIKFMVASRRTETSPVVKAFLDLVVKHAAKELRQGRSAHSRGSRKARTATAAS